MMNIVEPMSVSIWFIHSFVIFLVGHFVRCLRCVYCVYRVTAQWIGRFQVHARPDGIAYFILYECIHETAISGLTYVRPFNNYYQIRLLLVLYCVYTDAIVPEGTILRPVCITIRT